MVRKSTSITLRALGNFMYRVGEGEVGRARIPETLYHCVQLGHEVLMLSFWVLSLDFLCSL